LRHTGRLADLPQLRSQPPQPDGRHGSLTADGICVRLSGQHGDALVIACDNAYCELSVDERGLVQWDYRPLSGTTSDPARLADLATKLLTGQNAPFPQPHPLSLRGDLTLKSAIGLELRARGLDAELAVYADQRSFDASAEIVATNPGDADGTSGQVFITDDGQLQWTRDFSAGHETVTWHPEFRAEITDPEGLAADIVTAITHALCTCLPA
jgi:hypothetical protein